MRRPSRRAEQFAAALEGAPADPAVASLVRLAERLEAVPLAPAPDFSAALRERLVETAAQAVPAAPAAPPVPAPALPALPGLPATLGGPLVSVATGVLAAAVAISGTGVAASRSIPGETFYGVKRLAERVQLSFADGAVARAEVLLDQARARLAEVSALLDGHALPLDPDVARLVAEALADLDDRVAEATELLLRARDERAARVLAEFGDARTRLTAMAAGLPGELAESVSGTLDRVSTIERIFTGPGTVPGPLPTQVPTVPATPRPTDLPTVPVPTETPNVPVPSETPAVPVPTETPTLPVRPPTLPGLPTPLPF